MKPLTKLQQEALYDLAGLVGETVTVQTSRHEYSSKGERLYPDTWRPRAIMTATTLRGLAARGFVRIEESYWRGATITVLKVQP